MNTTLLIANGLVFLTFVVHTFGGDRELKKIQPLNEDIKILEYWIMARGAFHMVSVDFLFASIGLALINFTDYFANSKLLLQLLALYFLAYGLAFLITLIISKKFPDSFFKMWQWLLMFVISGLIYWGIQ